MLFSQPERQLDNQAINQSTSNAQTQKQQDSEQVFKLIDSMLSFEACLYYQIFPIALEGNSLVLGMVNPEDTAAFEYVKRILSYMNYSLVPQPVAAEEHRATLSTYLSRNRVTKPTTEKARFITPGHSENRSATKLFREKTTLSVANDQPTFVLEREPASRYVNAAKVQTSPPAFSSLPKDRENQPNKKQSNSQAAQGLPILGVQPIHLNTPIEALLALPPKKMLQELLGRVLQKGIGRLYFEPKSLQHGSIVCSHNGSLQSVLPAIPVQVFQALINELKHLTHLPLVPVQEPQQVEIERFYQNERLLLRLQVMPNIYGEQATLQVLRGAALQFHQQQQLKYLSRDTSAIAKQLQQKLTQLQERTLLNTSVTHEQQESLLALNQLLGNLEQYLQKLK